MPLVHSSSVSNGYMKLLSLLLYDADTVLQYFSFAVKLKNKNIRKHNHA